MPGWQVASRGRRSGAGSALHPSTITRELAGNGGRDGYRPLAAHRRALKAARRPQTTKLEANPRLAAYVVAQLQLLWSPEQVARRLLDEFPDDAEMRVSH